MSNKEQITHRLCMFVRFANSGKEKPELLRSLTHLQGGKNQKHLGKRKSLFDEGNKEVLDRTAITNIEDWAY